MDLYKAYLKLLSENKKLKEDIIHLKRTLGLESYDLSNDETDINPNIEITSSVQYEVAKALEIISEDIVSKYSSSDEKIALYMSLFKGRRDVFARKLTDKDGKEYYLPACYNYGLKDICLIPDIKCSDCNNQKFIQLNDFEINKHLKGVEYLAIYPLLRDEHCYLINMDFNKPDWKDNLALALDVCNINKIPAYAEQLKKGDAARLWFFFEDKISISLAKRFISKLITEADKSSSGKLLKTSEEIMPNTDYLQIDEFDNFLVLPLQVRDRAEHDSEFIDEKLNSYDDQWLFLNNISKISRKFVEQYIFHDE